LLRDTREARVFLFDTAMLTGQLAPSSLQGYQQDLAAYLRFCEGDPATALDPARLARWRTSLAQDTHLAPSTINRRLAAVRRVVQEAALQGYVDGSTAEAFRRVPGVTAKALKDRLRVRTPITAGQMRQLCEAPDRITLRGWRDRALLHTLASSGCRISEVVHLTTAQLVSREGAWFLEVTGKNQSTAARALLSHEAYTAIQAWVARRPLESPYIFISFTGKGHCPTGRPLHRSAAWRLVCHYAHSVGLTHVSPHSFRRFFVTELHRRHGIRVAQRGARHQRIETTAGYILDELVGGLSDGLY
jgi:site-specific recombinase XerD